MIAALEISDRVPRQTEHPVDSAAPSTVTADSAPDLLHQTLEASVQDRQLATPHGQPVRRLTHGVVIRRLVTHTDERGSLTELFDPRWGEHPGPLVFAYTFTVRPNVVKGWSLHRAHEDRYAMLQGDLALVLFDPRSDSPTYGETCRVVLSEHDRCLVNVPANVWHADHNIGARDVVVVNFPTEPYNHASPDRWRLPIDTPLIPYQFPPGTQGG